MSIDDFNRLVCDYRNSFPALITLKEAAQIARVPLGTVYEWSSRGLLDAFKARCGRHVRLDLAGFLRFLFFQPQN